MKEVSHGGTEKSRFTWKKAVKMEWIIMLQYEISLSDMPLSDGVTSIFRVPVYLDASNTMLKA